MILTLLYIISNLSGWLYVILWCLSVYPQTLLNFKIKSVAGFSMDFGIMHWTGFLMYSIYCLGGFVYPYMGTGKIHIVDLLFPTHWFLISAANLSQVWIYERGSQPGFDRKVLTMMIFMWTIVAIFFISEGFLGVSIPTFLNTFMILGYLKTIITFCKYCPQVYLNYVRKSTRGLSMSYLLFDLSGGVFSIIQQMVGKIKFTIYN